uniref:NADH-ubiquinone oxidoreductase chain 2 n=1 Tax=Cofana yasumatsui TaxID=2741154 RepID=A0A6M8PEC4_9HEMI|nr:NADH dehydrogenase subunit 2 [Cofana yasumatsui]QKG63355.1 NADH dehydrogenase subunit 2 [Cofana yasumatsui]
MNLNSTKLLFTSTMIVGVMVSSCSNNWFMIWSGIEISMMSFLPLFSSFNYLSSECMMKYFLIQSLSSSMLLLGLILMLNNINSTLIILASMMIKLGMSPFHNWMLVVMNGMSYMCNMILLTVMKIAPFIIVNYLNLDLSIGIICSLLVGSILGFNQMSFRMILGYSSIFNLSFICSCVNMTYIWTMYMLVYSFMLLSLSVFFQYLNLNYTNQFLMNEISLFNKISIWIVFLSMAGVPPMIGFFNKLMVIEYLINLDNMLLVTIMILSSLIISYYYLQMMYLSLLMSCLNMKWMKIFLFKSELILTISMFMGISFFLFTKIMM